jgi:general secretion pathway protein L
MTTAANFLRWWRDELAAALPERWLRAAWGRRLSVIRWQGPATPIPPAAKSARFLLRFPPRAGLRRIVALPAAAGDALHNVLRFEIDRLTPWPADEVLFGYRRLGNRDGKLEVELVVLPRATVEAACESLAQQGITPAAIDLEGDDPQAPPTMNLALDPMQARRGMVLRLGRLLAFGLGLPLLATTAWIGWLLAAQIGDTSLLERQVAAARSSTAPIAAMAAEIAAADNGGTLIAQQRHAVPRLTVVLEALSQLLPDTVWLTDVDLKGMALHIGGYAGDAAALIALLEASPHFAAAKFDAPSRRDAARNTERFSITVTIEQGLQLTSPEAFAR